MELARAWQGWATIVGLSFDFAGVALLAIEWLRAFRHAFAVRDAQLHAAYERNEARERGQGIENSFEREDELMAKEFSRLHHKEGTLRILLVVTGLVLILGGFALQVFGAWPIDPSRS